MNNRRRTVFGLGVVVLLIVAAILVAFKFRQILLQSRRIENETKVIALSTLRVLQNNRPKIENNNEEVATLKTRISRLQRIVAQLKQPDFVDLLNDPFVFDDFSELDDDTINGRFTVSGHVYRATGRAQSIREGRYLSSAGPEQAVAIAYLDLATKPQAIAAEFVFTAGVELLGCMPTTDRYSTGCKSPGQNAVIGTANGMGFSQGSIQLAIYLDHWRLFVVENPIRDPYPVLKSGEFEKPLDVNQAYKMKIEYDEDSSSVLLTLPDGNTEVVRHPDINKYWGKAFGIQMRRPSYMSGKVEFLRLAAR